MELDPHGQILSLLIELHKEISPDVEISIVVFSV